VNIDTSKLKAEHIERAVIAANLISNEYHIFARYQVACTSIISHWIYHRAVASSLHRDQPERLSGRETTLRTALSELRYQPIFAEFDQEKSILYTRSDRTVGSKWFIDISADVPRWGYIKDAEAQTN
jgi:hypothetical protein